jgi:hypothetical protein
MAEEEIELDEDDFGRTIVAGEPTSYVDQTEAWVNKKDQKIVFIHLPSDKSVSFKAFLTSFTDNFESEWASEQVYGRNDPIMTFQGTRRSISLGWQVVAGSAEEAKSNLFKCQSLFSMLYPVYGAQQSLQSPPIFRLKMMNLIQDVSNSGGLVGTASGFSFNPDLDVGFFDQERGKVYPKVIALECTYTALHTHELGYYDDGSKIGDFGKFPYGLGKKGRTPPAGGKVSDTEPEDIEAGSSTEAEGREFEADACGVLQSCEGFTNIGGG